jgi:hypothetical protein
MPVQRGLVQGRRMKGCVPIHRTINPDGWVASPPGVLPRIGRSLDHAPINISIRATRGRECSYPKTIGFSCVAPDARPFSTLSTRPGRSHRQSWLSVRPSSGGEASERGGASRQPRADPDRRQEEAPGGKPACAAETHRQAPKLMTAGLPT